jgi:hypothetical protein
MDYCSMHSTNHHHHHRSEAAAGANTHRHTHDTASTQSPRTESQDSAKVSRGCASSRADLSTAVGSVDEPLNLPAPEPSAAASAAQFLKSADNAVASSATTTSGTTGAALEQNTRVNDTVHPYDVPSSFGFAGGAVQNGDPAPPGNFTAVTGWGVLYPEAGTNTATDTQANVAISNMQTWVHLKTGGWVQVQSQTRDGIGGAHYHADFSGDSSGWNETQTGSNSVSVDAPQGGYNDHFWQGSRGTYAPGSIDGVYVTANESVNNPDAKVVAQLGADWWVNADAQFVSGFVNNPSPGMSNFEELSTQPKALYYISDPSLLTTDPPPGLARS